MDLMHLYVSEFVGSVILIFFGSSTGSSVLLKKTMASNFNAGWVPIVLGWGFAVAFGVYAALGLGGPAHLNPAVTVAMAVMGTFPWSQVIPVIIVQIAGCFVGAGLTMLFYYPHFKITGPDEGNCVGIFATGPAIDNRPFNFLSELLATFFFIFAILTLGKMSSGLFAIVLGFLVMSIGFSFGSVTGYAINPSRDFGPRLAYELLPLPNKGTRNWSYAWVPIVGPLAGGALAAWFYQFLQMIMQ